MTVVIRRETATDIHAIHAITRLAFGRDTEADLVGRLRADGDAVISMVAEDDGNVTGHVMLSRMTAPFRALGLAPLSVHPDRQRRGIAQLLVRSAVGAAAGFDGIFVLGDPAYYGRFGFRADLASGFTSPYAGPYLMVLPTAGSLPALSGPVEYARAFSSL